MARNIYKGFWKRYICAVLGVLVGVGILGACDAADPKPLDSESGPANTINVPDLPDPDLPSTQTAAAKNLTTELVISVPEELRSVMEFVALQYLSDNVTLTFRFGGNQTIFREVEGGAPADMIVTTGQDQLDRLSQLGFLGESAPVSLGDNQLWIFSYESVADLGIDGISDPRVQGIAVCKRDSIDNYSGRKRSVLNALSVPFKAVEFDTVEEVLDYVRNTEGAMGILTRTEMPADMTGLVKLGEASHEWFSPIFYRAVTLMSGGQSEWAQDFMEYLRSSEVQEKFRESGF